MRKLLLAVCLTLALPILFSGQQRIKSPMPFVAAACENETMGNYCDSEPEPRHPLGTGNGNNPGITGRSIGSGASVIALMFLTWAMRL
jgi:hypothetical protein